MSVNTDEIDGSPSDEQIARADREFGRLAFQETLSIPPSERFYIFPYDRTSATIVAGVTVGMKQADGPGFEIFHEIHAGLRMARAGWLDAVRVLTNELSFTDEELASIGLSQASHDADE
jgi:hypothetical protein